MGQTSLGSSESRNSCELHCGVQPSTEKSTEESTEDLSADLDQEDEELEELVQQIHQGKPLTVREYATADEDVATCATFQNSANWRQELRDMVVSHGHCPKTPATIEDNEDEESDEELPADVITSMTKLFSQKRGRTVIKQYITLCRIVSLFSFC